MGDDEKKSSEQPALDADGKPIVKEPVVNEPIVDPVKNSVTDPSDPANNQQNIGQVNGQSSVNTGQIMTVDLIKQTLDGLPDLIKNNPDMLKQVTLMLFGVSSSNPSVTVKPDPEVANSGNANGASGSSAVGQTPQQQQSTGAGPKQKAADPSLIPGSGNVQKTTGLSKIIKEVQFSVCSYTSQEDPEHWCDRLTDHAASYQLSWAQLIDNISIFFEESKDREVKQWFQSYRHKIRYQSKEKVDPAEIWNELKKELTSQFNLKRKSKSAWSRLHKYRYTNETAAEYVKNISLLVREAYAAATEQDILDHLYEHVTEDMDALFSLSPHHENIRDFQDAFEKVIKRLVHSSKKKSGSAGAASVITLDGPDVNEVRRMGSPGNCYFCQKPNHRALECYSLKNATARLMLDDKRLDSRVIYAVLVKGEPHDSPAFEKYRSNPRAYTAPLSKGQNNNNSRHYNQQQGSSQGYKGGRTFNNNGNNNGYKKKFNRRDDRQEEQPNQSSSQQAAPTSEEKN
ncbi:MAG: hypothetical protein ACHQ1H_10805 [Nitrososphaerales archaeon]